MTHGSYKQFCPVALAAEILCTRWTMVLLRELVAGSTRFNELRRGVPRMSPALLSQRLKALEITGIVRRSASETEPCVFEYHLTKSGRELEPVVMAFGNWGQRWVEKEPSLQQLDVSLLMWDMRRHLNPTPMPKRRTVLEFLYPELPVVQRKWWLLVGESMQNPGGITRPLIELDHRWRTGSRDNDGGRHPRACRSAPQYGRRGRAARSFCSSASVVSCSCAWRRSR